MQDRVPLYPGRVTLTPVAGQENTFDMVRADQPIQEGTPMNKANLLSDEVAAAIAALTGADAPVTPNEALNVLAAVSSALKSDATKIETGSYTGTGNSTGTVITLEFGIEPQLVVVQRKDYSSLGNKNMGMPYEMIAVRGAQIISIDSSYDYDKCNLSWGSKSLSISNGRPSSSPSFSMNLSGVEYLYFAIG